MQEEQELPKGWVWATIEELAADTLIGLVRSANDQKPTGNGVPYIKMNNIDMQGRINLTSLVSIEASSSELKRYSLTQGDVLFNTRNSVELVGKTGLFNSEADGIVFNNNLMRIRFKQCILPAFAVQALCSPEVRKRLDKIKRATTSVAAIYGKDFQPFTIPLPPLPEQRRIVAKLEELFSRLDAGVAAVRQSQQLLKRYRQSVLHAAVTGALTSAWRAAHPAPEESGAALLARIRAERRAQWEAAQQAKHGGQLPLNGAWKNKYQKPAAVDTTELPELPEGWVWASVEQLGEVTGGLTKNAKRGEFALQIPYLRVANVQANKLILNQIENIGVTEAEIPRTLLQKGDLLVVEGNGSPDQIGRVAIWDGSISPCLHQNHLIKVRLQMTHQGSYVLHWLLSKEGRDHIRKVASSTSGLYTLSISKISALPVPLPPLAEQAEIVAEVERRLSTIDALELTLAAELKRAERLRQSLLHRAFTGRLVPQDATAEPAGELLARLQSAPPGRAKAKASRTKAAAAPVDREAGEGKRRGRPRKAAAVEAMAEVVEVPLPAGTQTTLGF